ncbi:MAG: hypothetical protein C4524_10635 [Candidatus Zixiibacteriota bacterium]|nr:MAG: hypothetical protein C4524_10635 [candidate division Zixibacteria bacterium]
MLCRTIRYCLLPLCLLLAAGCTARRSVPPEEYRPGGEEPPGETVVGVELHSGATLWFQPSLEAAALGDTLEARLHAGETVRLPAEDVRRLILARPVSRTGYVEGAGLALAVLLALLVFGYPNISGFGT